jgi:L-arabinokinase
VAATVAAVKAALGLELEPHETAAVCQRVENHWLCTPVGIGTTVGVLLGEAHTLTEVQCKPCSLAGAIRLPDNVALIGVECGVVHADAQLKYARVRTATFMGRALIDRIIQHDGSSRLQWDGYLSSISASDFVERFRDRIPTKLKGREYLDRFGETEDTLTQIEPGFVYKIRSRTEHHIYEHARACQFAESLSRASRNRDDRALRTAGELMYASHWSYGQRCGLGSIETDLLVNLIREHGSDDEIFGAKITGMGCGGVVAVLMRTGNRAAAAVDAAIKQYQARTGRTATILQRSIPGALVTGARQV